MSSRTALVLLAAAVRAPDVRQRLDELAVFEPVDASQEALAETMRTEIARYGKIIKTANVKAE